MFSDASETTKARWWCCTVAGAVAANQTGDGGFGEEIDQDQQELIKYKNVKAP